MSASKTILVADDDAAIRTVLNQALARAGYEVRSTGNAATLWRWAAEGEGDLVVTDVMLPDSNVFDILPRIKKFRPELPIVVMSAQNTIMTAITAAERGAYEYLPKPFDLNELVEVVGRGLEQASARQAAPTSQTESEQALPIIGRSAAMQDIYRIIARLTQTDLTVMIMGESGTGKELVAQALHDYGNRRKRPFVALNMAAIPRDLIESELFGHEKGAFTGAGARYAGRFEQAAGGTLFLDEIGDMPMEAQTRLLRVLQEGTFTTVGGSRSIKADVRIIAATHRDLDRLIQQGLFREDLYFRLNVVPLRLPPLRERTEDIPDLVRHFLAVCEAEGLPARFLDTNALERLKAHRWPGNVRELENLVRRLSAIQADERTTEEAVSQALSSTHLPSDDLSQGATNSTLGEFAESYLADYFSQHGGGLPPAGLYDKIIKEVEEPLLNAALTAVNGNQLKASDLLGINRNTLRKKMKEHNIRAIRGPGIASPET